MIAGVRRLYAWLFLLLLFSARLPAAEVFYTIDSRSYESGQARPETVNRMVADLVMSVTGEPTVEQAWRSLVKPQERVALKVAASAGSSAGTTPEVVAAVVAGLKASGVPNEHIIIWDRERDDLVAAGLGRLGESGALQLSWIGSMKDYDSEHPLFLPVMGKLIVGDHDFKSPGEVVFSGAVDARKQLSDESHFPKVVRRVDKIINLPSLTDSFLTGINGALANVTVGWIDNWRRFTKPPLFGDPYIAEIYAQPIIREKVVLTILDALRVQYAGGPFPNPNYVEPYQALFASRDPVALDATAARLVDEYRGANQLPSILPMTRYLETAASLGLGEARESKIRMIRAGTDRYE